MFFVKITKLLYFSYYKNFHIDNIKKIFHPTQLIQYFSISFTSVLFADTYYVQISQFNDLNLNKKLKYNKLDLYL